MASMIDRRGKIRGPEAAGGADLDPDQVPVVRERPLVVSCGGLVIGEDFTDRVPGIPDECRVGVQVVGQLDQRDGQCPAATSRPGLFIDP